MLNLQTEESFKVPLKLTTDLFYRTGDLGFTDAEQLFVTGRIKDVIIIRGKNHYPQDIEHTVEKTNIVAIKHGGGAAFSLEIEGYERLVIIQELERGYVNKVNLSNVIDDILKGIAIHHGLEAFAVILVKAGSLPKTSSNKIQRYACKKSFQENNLNIIYEWYKTAQQSSIFSLK